MKYEKADTYKETWERRRKNLEFDTYQEFLESDYWKRVKEKASKRDNYQQCEYCDCGKVELHHQNYDHIHTKDELGPIIAVCRDHHQLIHDIAKNFNVSVRISSRSVYKYHKKHQFLPKSLDEFNKVKKSIHGTIVLK